LLEDHWNRHTALSAESLGKAIFNYDALRIIRRDIKRREGIVLDEEDIAQKIHEMLSIEAREKIGTLKIRRKYKQRAKPQEPIVEQSKVDTPPTSLQPEVTTD